MSKSAGGTSPGYLAWSPNRSYLFALNSRATGITGGAVKSFSINPSDGKLTLINTESTGGEGPAHLCVHPSGKFVFVAHYGSGHVASIPVNANGTLDTATTVLPVAPVGYTPSKPGVFGPNAHMVMTNKSGTRLYVPCLDYDYVAIYNINATTGALTPNAPATAVVDSITSSRPGPRHMAFSADEKYAYVINELNSTMTKFNHNTTTGAMTAQTSLSTLSTGSHSDYTAAHVAVSPDNRTLYGSNREKIHTGRSSIASYRIDQMTGGLSLRGHETGGGEIRHPRDFTLDPTGKIMLVASSDANVVLLFGINVNGDLINTGKKISYVKAPTFVGVMPKASVLTTLQISPLTPTLVVDAKQTFTVNGFDQFGLAMATTAPQWRIVTGPGVINPTTGEFTAPSSADNTTIEVSDGGKTANTTVKTEIAGGGSTSSDGGGGGGGGCGLGSGAASWLILLGGLLLVLRTSRHRDIMR